LERLLEIQQTVKQIVSPRPYQPESLDVDATMHQILKELRRQSEHRLLEIIARLEHVHVEFLDPAVLRQVLDTLVKNAIENTPDEGRISISLESAPAGVLLDVQDSGVGIRRTDQDFLLKGFHPTQPTDLYSTRSPFDFDAGGKGLELLRLGILSESGFFDISFKSRRCPHVRGVDNTCPGSVSQCAHVTDTEGCAQAGGTSFSVLFPRHPKVALSADLLG
jgi:two-component system phosphate regulon sensor histidine kinase PhoR